MFLNRDCTVFSNLPFASLAVEFTSSSRGSATQTDAKIASDTPEKMRIDYCHIHHMKSVQKPENIQNTRPEFFWFSQVWPEKPELSKYKYKKRLLVVFCFENCSDLLLEIVLVIEKKLK